MRLLAMDIESASHYVRGSLCSFGYVIFEYDGRFCEIERDDILINPRCRVVDKHCKLVYDRALYKKSPDFATAEKRVSDLLKGADLVIGHAINNDLRFLADAYKRYNIAVPTFKYICTQVIHRALNNQLNSIGIDAATEMLGLEGMTAHKAVDDAFVAAKLLEHMLELTGLSIEGLLDSLTLIFGEFSNAYHIKQHDARRNKDMLFNYYADQMPAVPKRDRRKKRKYSFDQAIILDDLNYARNLLYSIECAGGICLKERIGGGSSFFVTKDNQEISPTLAKRIQNANQNGSQIKIITDQELKAQIQFKTREYKNDKELLKILSRE